MIIKLNVYVIIWVYLYIYIYIYIYIYMRYNCDSFGATNTLFLCPNQSNVSNDL